jgi:ribonuclease T2
MLQRGIQNGRHFPTGKTIAIARMSAANLIRLATSSALALALIVAIPGAASASGSQASRAGRFDFYVLALSWSPSFCAQAERRHAPGIARECLAGSYAFVVHGLWPQYTHGFPQFCQVPALRLARSTVTSMLDLMPSRRLIYHEWDRHGTCSALPASAYFAAVRQARSAVRIPAQFRDMEATREVSPAAVAAAFLKANPRLAPADMAVQCRDNRLTEVRICFSRHLKFRSCPQIAAAGCQRSQLIMLPPRNIAR